jgi:CHAD domain-containing protein
MDTSDSNPSSPTPVQSKLLHLAQKRLEKFASLYPRVLISERPDPIHDTRVWSRRLQQVCSFLFPKPRTGKSRKLVRMLRRVRRALGDCRNLDVSIHLIQEKIDSAHNPSVRAAWDQIREDAQEKRASELAQARKAIIRYDIVAFLTRMQELLQAVQCDKNPEDTLRESIDQALVDWHNVLSSAKDNRETDALHRLRIAGKRLRYRLELLAELGENSAKEKVKTLKALQDQLGDWHDRHVLLQLLADFINRRDFLVSHPEMARALLGEMDKERRKNETAVANILKSAEKVRESWSGQAAETA